jgi:predicted Zn-dependent protease with MMP-like domain
VEMSFELTQSEYEYLKELAKTALQFLPSNYKDTFLNITEEIENRKK